MALRQMFEHRPVAQLDDLRRHLGRSGRTVFRVLQRLGYHSSYSHAGRFYTLRGIPSFDSQGLWSHQGAGFSSHGTLKETLVVLVERADAGCFHRELETLLRVRVHNTLLELAEDKRLRREPIAGEYLYVSAKGDRAAAQLLKRRSSVEPTPSPPAPQLALARVVDILLAVIRKPRSSAKGVADALRARGIDLTEVQVESVFTEYGLGKKTVPSRSRRSRR